MRTGELGFWWHSLGGPPPRRAPLQASLEVDVAIVGAGFTGLWTAYYLKQADPSLQIAVLEAQVAGFGASGRNGGWLSGFFSGPTRLYERRGGSEGLQALQRAMFQTVEEVAGVLDRHGLQVDLLRSGQLEVALNRAQLARLREEMKIARAHGLDDRDLRELGPEELADRLRVNGALGASFTPHVARIHPAKLVLGLTAAVEALGVKIYEGTPVRAIEPRRAETDGGTVRAPWVVRATEGYTPSLHGQRRALVPMNSSMIITEPLPATAWEEIGWRSSELLSDAAHAYVYLQRTLDGRIAIGGRGFPYRYGSRTNGPGDTSGRTIQALREKLLEMFPATATVEIEHAWSGVLGVPRDWGISVEADASSGLAWAGGYVGEGVACANLAGRTLRDLILGQDTPLTKLPWVGRHPRHWEPEPFRWGAIHAVYALYRQADRLEGRGGQPSRLGRLIDALSGRA